MCTPICLKPCHATAWVAVLSFLRNDTGQKASFVHIEFMCEYDAAMCVFKLDTLKAFHWGGVGRVPL